MNIKNNSQHDLSTYYELSTSHAPLILPAILRSRAFILQTEKLKFKEDESLIQGHLSDGRDQKSRSRTPDLQAHHLAMPPPTQLNIRTPKKTPLNYA